jgi:hypothetical protein
MTFGTHPLCIRFIVRVFYYRSVLVKRYCGWSCFVVLIDRLWTAFVWIYWVLLCSLTFWHWAMYRILKPIALFFLRQGLSRVATTSCFTLQTNVLKEASLLWPQYCWNSLNYTNYCIWPRRMTGWQYSSPNISPLPHEMIPWKNRTVTSRINHDIS